MHLHLDTFLLVRYPSVASTFRRPHVGPHSLAYMIPSSASVSLYVISFTCEWTHSKGWSPRPLEVLYGEILLPGPETPGNPRLVR